MQIKSKKLLKIKNVSHGFFSNRGGISKGIYRSLNCGLGSRDSRKNILYNLEIIKKKFKIKNINLLKQVHSNKIIHLKKSKKNLRIGIADGIFTSLTNNLIGILTADCAPILLSSKCGNYICALHGGWKGLYRGIIKKGINLFKKHNIKNKDIICSVGPCINVVNYEVKHNFMNKILKKNRNYKKFFKIKKNKILFDLKKFAKKKLVESGLHKNNIEIHRHDTYSKPSLFYSYRRSVHKKEDDYGRNISIIVKKNHKDENNILYK